MLQARARFFTLTLSVVRQTKEDREGDEHVVHHGHRVRRRGDQRREIEDIDPMEDVAGGRRRRGETFVVRLNRWVMPSEVLSEDLQAIGVNERVEQRWIIASGHERSMGDQFLFLGRQM